MGAWHCGIGNTYLEVNVRRFLATFHWKLNDLPQPIAHRIGAVAVLKAKLNWMCFTTNQLKY